MNNEVALDLTSARKKSGLSQADCAHLLGIDQGTVSLYETGKRLLTLRELCTLSLLYGRTVESLARGVLEDVASYLPDRLGTLPKGSRGWLQKFNRNSTIEKARSRIERLQSLEHGAA